MNVTSSKRKSPTAKWNTDLEGGVTPLDILAEMYSSTGDDQMGTMLRMISDFLSTGKVKYLKDALAYYLECLVDSHIPSEEDVSTYENMNKCIVHLFKWRRGDSSESNMPHESQVVMCLLSAIRSEQCRVTIDKLQCDFSVAPNEITAQRNDNSWTVAHLNSDKLTVNRDASPIGEGRESSQQTDK